MTCCDRRLHLGLTGSVCPVCLATIPAERCAEGDTVYLKKTCPVHGTTSTPVWRGLESYLRWGNAPRAFSQPPVCATEVERGCPYDCGLCPDHRQQSCCVLLEVTSRCDLACPVCYASASRQGADASQAEIGGWLDTLAVSSGGRVHIQLSGGEPTVRDDLPEIVALVRSRGFEFVQLNTNGVRIAREPEYLAALAKAGLDCVFLQFDGINDDVYQRLRGAKLMRLKTQAIRNCGQAGIGVVLTPTLVPGVNVDQIGAIVDFAIAETPAVRAVHFQPVSYFGRCLTPPENASRITLPEVMEALIAHGGGTIQHGDFHPGSAENPYCSFSGRFVIGEDGRLRATGEEPQSCCGVPAKKESSACCGVPAKQESEGFCIAPAEKESTSCRGAPAKQESAGCCGGPVEQETPASCSAPANQDSPANSGPAPPSAEVARERRYVAGQWTRPDRRIRDVAGLDAFDTFLAEQSRTLGLSGMAFQDAWTLDTERLRQCHIHVVAPDRRIIPFCAYNLTDSDGRALYRPNRPAGGEEPDET